MIAYLSLLIYTSPSLNDYAASQLYTSQNCFRKKSKNNFARVKSSAPFVRGKSSAFSSPGITTTKIWFSEKPKTKPVLVYLTFIVCLISVFSDNPFFRQYSFFLTSRIVFDLNQKNIYLKNLNERRSYLTRQ